MKKLLITWAIIVLLIFGQSTITVSALAPISYTLTYDGNSNDGGTPPNPESIEESSTTVVSGPTDLSLTGSVFKGWNTAADGSGTAYVEGDTFTMSDSNVTLYAQWLTEYTLTYDGNGSDGGTVPSAEEVAETLTTTVSGPTDLSLTGSVFKGWNTAADGSGTAYVEGDTFTMSDSNVTLYAQWLTEYTLTYDGNGSDGGTVPSSEDVAETLTTTVSGPTDLSLTGSVFKGWNTAADGSGTAYVEGDTFTMSDSNVTLYAQWLTKYTLTYDGNGSDGGTVPSSEEVAETLTTTVSGPTDLSLTGSVFKGWNTAADGSGTAYVEGDTFTMSDSNVTLYAQWLTKYTLTYDGNGSDGGTVPSSEDVAETLTTTVSGPTDLSLTGSVFKGWNTAGDGSGTAYVEGDTFTMSDSNVTLYAQWETAYTITYDGNGHTGGSVPTDATLYVSGTETTTQYADNLVKTGKTLIGWNTASDGSGTHYARGSSITLANDNISLYAEWSDPIVFANNAIRFGTGSQTSFNEKGNLLQPFYYDSVLQGGGWFSLTFNSYPLNYALAVSGDGTNEWNSNGTILVDQSLTNYSLDLSGYNRVSESLGHGTIIVKGNVTIDGKLLFIERKYEIGSTDKYIKFNTKITNLSGSDVSNIRIWVGTQDDYVGNDDNPTKKRGNLVDGTFIKLDDKANRARSLEISSGGTGVLFYTTHEKADTIIANSLSMNAVTTTNPQTTGPEIHSDNSYGIFFRLDDLADGESDEAGIYYAAGELADLGEISEELNDVTSATPGRPTNVVATAGYSSATVSFTAPQNTGDSDITSYTVTSTPGGITKTGTGSPITVTGLTVGTGYTFTVFATNGQGNSNESNSSEAVIPTAPSTSTSDSDPEPDPEPKDDTGVSVIVNGEEQKSGTINTKKNNNGTTDVIIDIDERTIDRRINKIIKNDNGSEQKNTIEVPVTIEDANTLAVDLDGDIIGKLDENNFDITIKSTGVEYAIPTEELNFDEIMEELEIDDDKSSDVVITFHIDKVSETRIDVIKLEAEEEGLALVVPPIDFRVEAKSKSDTQKSLDINDFNQFVSRIVEIPEGVESSNITTGIVYNEDGTFAHIPTLVYEKDGKYYARLNSLTNSEYTLIWNPIEVPSVEKHWSKAYVVNMASRLIIRNPNEFEPDRSITRGDLAEYIVKGAGLFRTNVANENIFIDIQGKGDMQDAITIAYQRGIISGYPDGTFRPSELITREEAMMMFFNALKYVSIEEREIGILNQYNDLKDVSLWARPAIIEVIEKKVFNGSKHDQLLPQGNITYAEAATAVYNMLIQSNLINE